MRKAFVAYLKSIDISQAVRKRIEEIHLFSQKMCSDQITGIFVCEYIKEDGSREYENLWFFSKKYWMEAKRFIPKDDFEMTPVQKRVDYYNIQKQHYDFKKATEKSRLYLSFHLDTGIGGDLKASKENCDHLRNIILKYVVPNLKA